MASTGALADAKSRRRAHGDAVAAQRRRWIRRASYYHADLVRYLRSIVPPGSRVLDVGCGTGAVLASLEPSRGLGIDLSPEMVRVARAEHGLMLLRMSAVALWKLKLR
jgi:SAM-dependent methyltransferase